MRKCVTNLDKHIAEWTWRDAAYAALCELERMSEAVYDHSPEHWLSGRTNLFNKLGLRWDAEKFLTEAKVLGYYAIRALMIRNKWDKESLATLLAQKQHDYGTGNILAFGEFGIAVRMSDKIARLKNLRGRTAKNESMIDTLMDIIGYTVVAMMLENGTFFYKELGLDSELV
jgi:hypothetical protein